MKRITALLPLSFLLTLPAPSMAGLLDREWNLGVAVTGQQSLFTGGKTTVGARPILLNEDGFEISGPAWSFSRSATQEFYIGAGLDEFDYERGDSAELADMATLDRAIHVRLGGAWKSASGVFGAEVGKDLVAHKGTHVKGRYTQRLAAYPAVRPYAEVQWLSAKLTDYYVGVDTAETRSNRPRYEAGTGTALKLGLKLEQALSPRLTLVGDFAVTGYNSAVSDSPIVERSSHMGALVGLAYRW